MNLTKNFTLEELTTTSVSVDNTPNEVQTEKLLYLANYILQPVRDRFGKIHINSGFRSPEVNKAINGRPSSQHMSGEAADIFPLEAELDVVFEWIKMYLKYGQVIKESENGAKWIHVSLPRIGGLNMQVLFYNDGVYSNG